MRSLLVMGDVFMGLEGGNGAQASRLLFPASSQETVE